MSFFRQFPKLSYGFTDERISQTITDYFRFVQSDFNLVDDISVYQTYQIKEGERPDVVSLELYGTPDYYWTFFLCNERLKNGMKSWPLSSQQFELYIENEYEGYAITTRPTLVWNGDRSEVIEYRDSLSGKFILGETVIGSLSGATGTVFKRDAQLSQLIVRQVNGNFRGDGADYIEQVSGQSDTVTTHIVYPWRDAPHHFVKSDGTISYNARYIDEDGSRDTNIPAVPGLVPNPTDVVNSALTPVSNYEYELDLNDSRANIRVIRPSQIYSFAQRFNTLLNA